MHSPADKKTILIVDDAAVNLQVLDGMLGGKYRIKTTTDGAKAMRLARQLPQPDLILLDIMMPDLSGYDVCRMLKNDPETMEIPVIFVTCLDDVEDEERGLRLGAVDYIHKPFSPPIIRARVDTHIALKSHRDHLEDLISERTRQLESTREATIESMAALAEYRDPETGGHIKRTQHYIRALAELLRNQTPFRDFLRHDGVIDRLYSSAPLHDIGKVGIPDSILLKPGKLTTEEFSRMQEHTTYGYNTLRATESKLGREDSFLTVAKEIAYCHHEKWDGSGYPQGLVAEQIPIPARLMAVADVYDALISKRVYKQPFPHAKACEIMHQERGHHFDPVILDAFLAHQDDFRQIAFRYADYAEEEKLLREPISLTVPK